VKCKVGAYNDLIGQPGCKRCGPSATTPPEGGAVTCECLGERRKFIKSSGSCLCEAGYKPKNGADPGADSKEGCELIVKAACAAGQEVDVEGNCVEDPAALCAAQCGGDGGTVVEGTGVCECATVPDVDTVCDADCRASQPKAALSADGKLTVTDPVTGKTASYDPTEVPGFGGKTSCSGSDCKMVSIGKADDGSFTSDYGMNEQVLAKAGIESKAAAARRALNATGRQLQASQPAPTGLVNPVICVNAGSIVLFDVNAAEGRYPVYLKDSILNTNQDFDRSPFDDLAKQVKNGVAIQIWSHEFAEKGIYAFADSKDGAKLTIVAVKADNEACKDPDAFIQSMTAASLSAVGIESQPKSVAPDWAFVTSTVVLLLFINFAIIALFVLLSNAGAQQTAPGGEGVNNIYYDKIHAKEQLGKKEYKCHERFRCCQRKKTDEVEDVA
jgi:hypothetical protein